MALRASYGPVVAVLVRNLARVAERRAISSLARAHGGAGDSKRQNVVWLLVASAVLAALIGVRVAIVDSNGSGRLRQRRPPGRQARRGRRWRTCASSTPRRAPPRSRWPRPASGREELRQAARGKSGIERSYLTGEAGRAGSAHRDPPADRRADLERQVQGPRRLLRPLPPPGRQAQGAPRPAPGQPGRHREGGLRQREGVDPSHRRDHSRRRSRFLFGSLTEGFPRRRRPLLVAGWVCLAIGLVFAIVVEVAL